jgi:hypothetical protein
VARAKRTDRAAARRRYRSEQGLAAFDAEEPLEPLEPLEEPAPAGRVDRSRAPQPPPSARRSIGAAFREAFHPLDLRGDLRALPQLVRDKALWIPVALTIATAALFVIIRPEGRSDPASVITVFLYQYFLVTPAIGGVFIAGFLAKRASWLLGMLVGLVAATCYSLLILNGFIGVPPSAAPTSLVQDVIIASFLLSPVVGAFFASTAAWYRRFLYLSNPNRGRARADAARRPDGRTRATRPGQQRAVPRR